MSNHPDRRINVFSGLEKPKDNAYYRRLYEWLEGGGRGATLSLFDEQRLDAFQLADRSQNGNTGSHEWRTIKVRRKPCFIGKVASLSLGYQGGVNAFQNMAGLYEEKIDNKLAESINTDYRG